VSPSSTREIRFNDLRPREDASEVEGAIRRVIASGWFILGPEVEAFEQEFGAASGAVHAVAVGNGTDAIALTLRGLGIGPGDEVITSPLSAAFSALAILMTGARPVFADIDAGRLTLDPSAIEAAITSRTRAILPVHLYGQPADMMRIADIARRHNLAVVEDACQAHLATCEGRPVGTMGVAGAFSFYPTKNLGALGDGGAVITSDAALAARVRRLRNGGQSRRYHHDEPGVNSRLDEMQAAVLRARLKCLRGWIARRREIADCYRRELVGKTVAAPPELDRGHVYHLFPVLTRRRQALEAHLAGRGVETLVHYPLPLPRQQAFAASRPAPCPIADRIANEVLSLPLHPGLSDSDVAFVADAVCAFTE
jgi:dTDP-4-amino-4,6-dideoxygalactose transaminase